MHIIDLVQFHFVYLLVLGRCRMRRCAGANYKCSTNSINAIVFVFILVLVALFAIGKLKNAHSISLDPDEDKRDSTIFDGLKRYMISEMSADECMHFKTVTLRNLAKRAQTLKSLRPPRGLNFSLQQQREYRYTLLLYRRVAIDKFQFYYCSKL